MGGWVTEELALEENLYFPKTHSKEERSSTPVPCFQPAHPTNTAPHLQPSIPDSPPK